MKKGALIFNVVLSVAVLVLFYLHFTSGPSGKPKKKNGTDVPVATDSKILYVDLDSLNGGYAMFADLEQKFEQDNLTRQEKLQSMQNTLQAMYRNYEREVATMTTRERQKEEERITQYQQTLQTEAGNFQQMAAMQEAQMITQIYDSLTVFFQDYAVQKECDMIFAYQKGGQIMYISPSLDVTGEVVTQLNDRYAKSKANGDGLTTPNNNGGMNNGGLNNGGLNGGNQNSLGGGN